MDWSADRLNNSRIGQIVVIIITECVTESWDVIINVNMISKIYRPQND